MFKSAIAALGIAAALASAGTIYPTAMRVTDVDPVRDIVTMETRTGYIYQMYDVADWTEGDLAAVLMYNSTTPEDIADDIILSARYSGWYF